MNYDVAGLGNALVDALVRIPDDGLLDELELKRGLMHPVDHDRWHAVYERVRGYGVEVQTGGSCANTIATLALLGARSIYCGQVGGDDFGELYTDHMSAACGAHALVLADGKNTGKCLSIISESDAERTMLTDLGCAVELPSVDHFADAIRGSRVIHFTGYLFLGGPIAEASWKALDIAKAAGVPISLDVADPFVIGVIKDSIQRIVDDYAQIVFLNAEEARALTGLEPEEALHAVAEKVETTIVKRGSKGSLVKQGGETYTVGVHTVEALDTTGAGDAYAAGYLYGWLQGWSPARSGDLGSRVASLTVAQVGAVCRDRDALARALSEVTA